MLSNSEDVEATMVLFSPEYDPGVCGLCFKLFSGRERESVLISDAPSGHGAGQRVSCREDNGAYTYVKGWSSRWVEKGKSLRHAFAHIRCWKRKEKREGRGKKT